MSTRLTPDEIATGDEVATFLERVWGWYLAGGILSVIFGFFVLSYQHASLFALAYFAGAYFVAVGILQLAVSSRLARHRWLYLVMGVVSMGAGIACLVWPRVTLLVVAVLIGWVLLLWGITDLVGSLSNRSAPYWWIYLIRGLASIALGIWALRHPGHALVILVVVVGLWCILYGTIEIIGAFGARHARRTWDQVKQQLA